MISKLFLLFVVTMIIITSCGSNSGNVEIRIENISEFDYVDITVISFNESVNITNLNSNEISDYHIFQNAYSYSFVSLMIDGEEYIIEPIDFIGKEELNNGKFTYQITTNSTMDTYGRLGLLFVED